MEYNVGNFPIVKIVLFLVLTFCVLLMFLMLLNAVEDNEKSAEQAAIKCVQSGSQWVEYTLNRFTCIKPEIQK
jgi:preprotein translocase subunit SecG